MLKTSTKNSKDYTRAGLSLVCVLVLFVVAGYASVALATTDVAPTTSPRPVPRPTTNQAPTTSPRPVPRPTTNQSPSTNTGVTVENGVVRTPGGNIPLTMLPSGVLGVTSCQPPGSQFWGGRDGLPCAATGLSSGLAVTGICQAGHCRATSFTSASGALQQFAQGIGQSFLSSLTQQLIGGLLGGGGGGYYNPYATGTTSTSTLDISFDDIAVDTSNGDDTGYSFVFDDNQTNLTYDQAPPIVTTAQENIPPVQPVRPVSITERLYNTAPTRTSDGVATIPGQNQFERDLIGITFNTDTSERIDNTLSIADLERAAYEARMRELALQDTGRTSVDFSDYESSSLYQHRNEQEISSEEVPAKRPWWVVFIEFIASLLGIGN